MMSKRKSRLILSEDERTICIALVRGYDRRRRRYEQRRLELLSCGGRSSLPVRRDGFSDVTGARALSLIELENEPETRRMKAVESGLAALEPGLRQPMIENVADRIPYEHLPVPCCRDTFFARKREFLQRVAAYVFLGDWQEGERRNS